MYCGELTDKLFGEVDLGLDSNCSLVVSLVGPSESVDQYLNNVSSSPEFSILQVSCCSSEV